jgi:hypothetical protein
LEFSLSAGEGVLDYDVASSIGDVGERRVSEALHHEARVLGSTVIDNLLLVEDRTTAQIDHLVIDRFGILVVETKNYRALIKGKSDDKTWTACYRGAKRRRERFQNPLRQNDRHREMLHRALGANGRALSPEYVQSLVVFAGGELAGLGVDPADSMRVIPDREIVDYLRARAGDFPPNHGALDPEQVADLVSLLKSVNQADNPEIVELHGENVRRATRRFGDRFRRDSSPSRPASPPRSYSHSPAYNQGSRYPDASAPQRWGNGAGRRTATRALLYALFLLLVAWMFLGGGLIIAAGVYDRLASAATGSFGSSPATPRLPEAATPAPPPVHDVALAQQRLKEADPQTYAKLANPSSPALSTKRGLPTYSWQYIEKAAKNAVAVRTISITLDASGRIVGVTSSP